MNSTILIIFLCYCIAANRPESVEMFLKSSLADLQLDYVDLYLVHTPVALALIGPGEDLKKQENGDVVMESVDHLAVWKVN